MVNINKIIAAAKFDDDHDAGFLIVIALDYLTRHADLKEIETKYGKLTITRLSKFDEPEGETS